MDKICIIGLGYVGLPLAVAFASKLPVVGFDIDEKRIKELKDGYDRTLEITNSALDKIKSNLIERLDELTIQLKSSVETKAQSKQIEMEVLQLKQIITDLKLVEPSKKGTPIEPSNNDTTEEESKTINIFTNLSKHKK